MKDIFERISIRKFEDKPVEHEKTEQILRAAMALRPQEISSLGNSMWLQTKKR